MEIGFGMITAGTAWARVEGGVHYPSDVLAGMALGHFVENYCLVTIIQSTHHVRVIK